MRVALLGPLEVDAGGRPVPVGAAKERAVLSLLALRNGNSVATHELIEALWGDHPPATARKALQMYVSKLRRVLPPASVVTTYAGYSLQVDAVDAVEFEQLLARSRSLAAAGGTAAAIDTVTEAMALWRGPPLADLADHHLGVVQISRLEELHRNTEEELFDLRLGVGHHEALVAELEAAVAREPLRERRWAQLMLALYRSGRQAEALRAYQRLRQYLGDELGLEPTEELVALEDAILAQKPELRWTPRDVSDSQPGAHDRHPTRLAVAANSFIGRDEECTAVAGLLGRGRLVTIVGPGGCGKTRMALEVVNRHAPRLAGGVTFVAFAGAGTAISDPPSRTGEAVERRVADAIGVTEEPEQAMLDTLVAAIGGRQMLLVFDNCEHVVAGVARVAEKLVSSCPHLLVLATSREALRSPSENRFSLEPLSLPAAVELFTDRARAASPDMDLASDSTLVAHVCQQLDRLPLALEIAAARLETCTLQELADGLDDRLRVLEAGVRTVDDRHRTMRNAIDWSYRLLDRDEQTLMRSMGVFVGGATRAEVQAVCGPADPTSLIQKSLVLRTSGPSGTRVSMHETIRQFALDRLDEATETAATRRRHAETYVAMAEATVPEVRGAAQRQAMARLDAERANFTSALSWASDVGQREVVTRAGIALWWYWFRSNQAATGLAWLRSPVDSDPGANVDALGAAGYLAWVVDDFADAKSYAERALQAPGAPSRARALALAVLARVHGDKGDFAGARRAALDSERLYMTDGDAWTVAWARRCRASAALLGGDPDEARSLTTDAMDRFRQIGDEWAVAGCLDLLSGTAILAGDLKSAFALAQESVLCHRAFHDVSGTRWSLFHLAKVARDLGDRVVASQAATESLQLAQEHGFRIGALRAHLFLAELDTASAEGRHHARQAAQLARQLGDQPRLGAANVLLASSGDMASGDNSVER